MIADCPRRRVGAGCDIVHDHDAQNIGGQIARQIGFETVRKNIDENGVEMVFAQEADHMPCAGFFIQHTHAVDGIALAKRIIKPLPCRHIDRIASSACSKPAKLYARLGKRGAQTRENRIGPAYVRTDKVSTFHGQNLVATETPQGRQDFEGTTPSKPYSGISGGNGYTAGQCIEIALPRISAMRGTPHPTIEYGVHPSASFPAGRSGLSLSAQRETRA